MTGHQHAPASQSKAPTPVIIDTDPGVDDILALLLALSSPEIQILAITITFGNTDTKSSLHNVLKLFTALEQHFESDPGSRERYINVPLPHDVPSPDSSRSRRGPILIAMGAEGPLEGQVHSAKYFHGRDGLSNISTLFPTLFPPLPLPPTSPTHPHPHPLTLSPLPAHLLTLSLLSSHPPRTITLVCLGPLTNLALSLIGDETGEGRIVEERVGRVVAMGGALDVPGNTSPTSEFNFFADPFSVSQVLSFLSSTTSTTPTLKDRFTLLPLDITSLHTISFDLYSRYVDPSFDHPHPLTGGGDAGEDEGSKPLNTFTSLFMRRIKEIMLKLHGSHIEDVDGDGDVTEDGVGMQLHDPAALWFAIDNPPLSDDELGWGGGGNRGLGSGWKVLRRRFVIERYGEHTRGMLIVDRRVSPKKELGRGSFADGVGVGVDAMGGFNRAYAQESIDSSELRNGNVDEVGGKVPAVEPQTETREEAEGLVSVVEPELHPSPGVDGSKGKEVVKRGRGGGGLEDWSNSSMDVVVGTPGSEVLTRVMFERIWGVVLG